MHNSSHGVLDLFDFALEKMGIPTSACYKFYHKLKKTLDAGRVAQIQAHSEGNAIYNTIAPWFSKDERSRINFIGYGVVDIVPKRNAGLVMNYISGNDLVAFFSNPFNCVGSAMLKNKYVHFLKPSTINPIKEHMFMEESLQERVTCENEFLRKKYDLN